jgi:hypothetical protein
MRHFSSWQAMECALRGEANQMRIVDIRERTVPISRYRDASFPSGGLTTSIVALLTDVIRDGRPVTGYGFASIGRFA